MDRIIHDPDNSIAKEIAWNPVGPAVAKEGEATIRKITDEVFEKISQYRTGDNLILLQHTHLYVADFR